MIKEQFAHHLLLAGGVILLLAVHKDSPASRFTLRKVLFLISVILYLISNCLCVWWFKSFKLLNVIVKFRKGCKSKAFLLVKFFHRLSAVILLAGMIDRRVMMSHLRC